MAGYRGLSRIRAGVPRRDTTSSGGVLRPRGVPLGFAYGLAAVRPAVREAAAGTAASAPRCNYTASWTGAFFLERLKVRDVTSVPTTSGVCWEGIGHFPQHECPETVTAEILRWSKG